MLDPTVEDVRALDATLDGFETRAELRDHPGGHGPGLEQTGQIRTRDPRDEAVLVAEIPIQALLR